jgi:hypothetical protein
VSTRLQSSRVGSPVLPAAGVLVVLCVLMAAFGSIGNPFPLPATVMALAETAVYAGLPAALYLLGAIGLGRFFSRGWRGASDSPSLQIALGLSAMLTVSHLLGMLGLFAGAGGRLVAVAIPLVGVALLGHQLLAASRRSRAERANALAPLRNDHRWWYAAAGLPALALLLVAASSPPGWLWESEGRGYDALSYHLQVPQEWLAMGRLAPLEHNVYSYLPSYIEAAFYHIAVLMGAGERPLGMLHGEGYALLAAQWLHAGFAVLGALLIARLVMALISLVDGRDGEATKIAAMAGVLAGALYLSIPWVVVTGSLAYNDLGVVALTAAALTCALDRRLGPAARGALTGVIVGAACGIKPTALLFTGVPVGMALLAWSPRRQWLTIIIAGSIAGLAMLAPWLIRNTVYSGNPVFPFAASLLGHGHWSGEQAGRYAAAHRFDGTALDRLRLLVLEDANDPAGARHRGMLHPQWSVFFPVVLISALAALSIARVRRAGLLLVSMLALQLFVWLIATHLQSRFLLPLAATGAALFGVSLWALHGRLRLIPPAGAAAVIVVAATSLMLFTREPQLETGDPPPGPGAMLVPGPALRSGEFLRQRVERADPRERRDVLENLAPEPFANLALPRGSRLLLVGEATPLYYTLATVYSTTWDRSPLAEAILAAPGDARHWAEHLRGRGITHVLVNAGELDRLERSGFLDPILEQDRVQEFLQRSSRPVRAWPQIGVFLYELAQQAGDEP